MTDDKTPSDRPCPLAPCSGFVKGELRDEWIFVAPLGGCPETAEQGCQIKLDRDR